MDMLLISGLIGGLLSTAIMTLFEITAWKKGAYLGSMNGMAIKLSLLIKGQ
jgi:hypothetical protein